MQTEFNLKSASDLGKVALDAAKDIKISKSIKISIYGDADFESLITNAQNKIQKQIDDTILLTNAYYTIRKYIGEANDKVGITVLMRDIARIESLTKSLNSQLKSLDIESESLSSYESILTISADIPAIRERIEVTRERAKNPETRSVETAFHISVIKTQHLEYIRQKLSELQREKAVYSAQLAALNVNTFIRIDEATLSVLQSHKLL